MDLPLVWEFQLLFPLIWLAWDPKGWKCVFSDMVLGMCFLVMLTFVWSCVSSLSDPSGDSSICLFLVVVAVMMCTWFVDF